MRLNPARHRPSIRTGAAAIWAVVVIAIVSAAGLAATLQFANLRKQVDADRNRSQARWLARSGVELAVDRLLTKPDGSVETVTLFPGGEITITIRQHAKKEDVYQVESQGRFSQGPTVVVITERRFLRVQKNDNGLRVEVVAEEHSLTK